MSFVISTAASVPFRQIGDEIHALKGELREALLDVLDSGSFIQGPAVKKFEQQMADSLGVRCAIGVSSGSDALLASLWALNIGPGDRVITTPYTFVATAGAIARLGATPVFVDIHPATYNLLPDALESWMLEHPNERDSVKAIIPVHLFGQCADMQALLALANSYGIPIVEDACQALGAHANIDGTEHAAGSMGSLGCFSFHPTKNLGALGDAGMVTTNSPELASRIKQLRSHGSELRDHYLHTGGNFRLDTLQAAALLVKLKHFNAAIESRRDAASYYDQNLPSAICTPRTQYGKNQHTYHQYVISAKSQRDELRAHLALQQIETQVYYPLPLHLQECFAALGYRSGDLPNAERAAQETLALPLHAALTREMQDRVIDQIRVFYA